MLNAIKQDVFHPFNHFFIPASELPWDLNLKEKMNHLALVHLPIIEQLIAKKEYLNNIQELRKKIQFIDHKHRDLEEEHQIHSLNWGRKKKSEFNFSYKIPPILWKEAEIEI